MNKRYAVLEIMRQKIFLRFITTFIISVPLLNVIKLADNLKNDSNLSIDKPKENDKSRYHQSSSPYHPRTIHYSNMADFSYILKDRKIENQTSIYSDITQLYSILDSSDPEVIDKMEKRDFPNHEVMEDCKPMSKWQSTFHPTCNTMHELNVLDSLHKENIELFATKGFWRHAWTLDDHEKVIVKTLRPEHNFEDKYYENMRVDAVSMEQLTSSRYIINIYNFCGTSVTTEYAPITLLRAIKGKPTIEKLVLAKQIAKGVAAIHGIDSRPSLVHNDINFGNIIMNHRGIPMINDFNIAVLLMESNGKPCGFPGYFPNPQWKAPEESLEYDANSNNVLLTEKIDIYALGNVFYRILVGVSPWRNSTGSLALEVKEYIGKSILTTSHLCSLINYIYPYSATKINGWRSSNSISH